MSQALSVWTVLLLAVITANLPFLSNRLFGIARTARPKALWLRLLEWAMLYLLTGAVGLALEQHAGQIAPQGWEFYAVTLALFATLAFPGFVFRYLLRGRA